MDFSFSPEQDAFRQTLRQWMERTKLEIWGDLDFDTLLYTDTDTGWSNLVAYHRRLYEAGYIALHWPKEWGGAGAGLIEQAIYQDEALRLKLPLYGCNTVSIDRFGPTIMAFGTEAQKRRYLDKMLTGEEVWCQGYSEPNAGSDLAGLQTRAEIQGDDFVINGQKVWTSYADRAHMEVLLVRTDPKAPKHRGISYLLVDMKTPGITIRPLRKMTGETTFCEVFYDNVRVPLTNLVGKLNEGWQVSIATLMWERVSGGSRYPIEQAVEELTALSREVSFQGVRASEHAYVRQKLAHFTIEARCLKLARYRTLSNQLQKRVPGPESSFIRLFASELNLRLQMFADELLGPSMQLAEGEPRALANGLWLFRLLDARLLTIGAGTAEIQHNIIGERVLKLPKG